MTDEPTTTPDAQSGPAQRVAFEYIKSGHYRMVHVDGVFGGGGLRNLVINFFSERLPIPKRQVYELAADGKLSNEVAEERESRLAIVREVEVGLVMDLATAKMLVLWLGNSIAQAERVQEDKKARVAQASKP